MTLLSPQEHRDLEQMQRHLAVPREITLHSREHDGELVYFLQVTPCDPAHQVDDLCGLTLGDYESRREALAVAREVTALLEREFPEPPPTKTVYEARLSIDPFHPTSSLARTRRRFEVPRLAPIHQELNRRGDLNNLHLACQSVRSPDIAEERLAEHRVTPGFEANTADTFELLSPLARSPRPLARWCRVTLEGGQPHEPGRYRALAFLHPLGWSGALQVYLPHATPIFVCDLKPRSNRFTALSEEWFSVHTDAVIRHLAPETPFELNVSSVTEN